jgi:hypothetical protein
MTSVVDTPVPSLPDRAGSRVPPDEERCTWVKTSGRRCKQRKSEGTYGELCTWHEDMAIERGNRRRLADGTDDVSIEDHLVLELRTSYTMVKLAELAIMDLDVDVDAYLHPVTEREDETKEGGGDSGNYTSERTKRTQLMQAHPALAHYLAERKHHMDVVQTCVRLGLAAKQVQAVERMADSLIETARRLAELLGHDPEDDATRAIIAQVLRERMTGKTEKASGDGKDGTRAVEA